MSKRIFITGGAGFIGSHLVDVCLHDGHEVMVFDNFTSGRKEFLQNHDKLQVFKGDILDPLAVRSAIDGFKPTLVLHLAAIHFIPACENDPVMALRINVEGTENVLLACRNQGIRVVFTSTGAIYDPSNNAELLESSPVDTKDIYGLTKHTAERLVEYHIAKDFGDVVIARLFNAVGRRETNPHLIPAIMDQLSQGNTRVELGNLYPRRDYIHVEDIAEGLYALGIAEQIPSPVYNIGSGIEHSVGELVDLFSKTINKEIEIVQVPERMRKNDRPGQLAGIDRMKSEIGWQPKRSLKQAVEEIWEALLQGQNMA